MKRKPLYIETTIHCNLDTLWSYTQTPDIHQQWDLRFTGITYLPKKDPLHPQQFVYTTRVAPGILVKGFGESVATKVKNNGESTSVLKFWSDEKLSLIREGSGYWKYIPQEEKIRFYTGYDYSTRWGAAGSFIDKFFFRPLMVWATAWSFDCLKNWIEKGIHPKQAVAAHVTVLIASLVSGIVWIYHGLVPKLMYPHTGELDMLRNSRLFKGAEETVVMLFGIAEIIFGCLIIFVHRKWMHWLSIAGLTLLTFGAVIGNSAAFTWPFNPFSLNISMIAISLIAIINMKFVPRAGNCITKPSE